MNFSITKPSKKVTIAIGFLVVAMVIGLVQDLLHSKVNNYHFYFSESALYNSFWIFFIPLLWFQQKLIATLKGRSIVKHLLVVPFVSFSHIVLFSWFVNLFSKGFFDHAFYIAQVFGYAISNLLFISVFVYGSMSVFIFLRDKKKSVARTAKSTNKIDYKTSIAIVSGRKTVLLKSASILYITSEKPYISIHTSKKRFLHSETLQGIEKLLDPEKFFRIHKSTIVNIESITTLTSRGNGDYDIQLTNGQNLRMSRTYTEAIKHLLKVTSS